MFLGYMLHRLDSAIPWTEKELPSILEKRRHVANGHLPFDRRCRTCIQTAATGRALMSVDPLENQESLGAEKDTSTR